MELLGVHHVSLNVDDLAAADHFYTAVLGFEPIARPDLGFPGSWLQAGPQEIHLLEFGAVPDDVGQHVAFRTNDLDAAIAHLRAAAVEVSDPRSLPTGARQAFLRDPSGNLLELNEPAGG